MRFKITLLGLIFSILILFNGCSRVINWGKKSFNQAESRKNLDLLKLRSKVKTISVYDSLKTLAIFDTLYLNNNISKNNNSLKFYVLAYVPGFLDPILELSNPENSLKLNNWQIKIIIDNKTFDNKKLKLTKISLEDKYKFVFGRKFSKFKQAYIIELDDLDKLNINSKNIKNINIEFESLERIAKVKLS